MPRFHFHLHEGSEIIGDGEGCVLFDAVAARKHSTRIVRDLVAHEVLESGTVQLDRHIEVADPAGNVVDRIAFSDIIHVEPPF